MLFGEAVQLCWRKHINIGGGWGVIASLLFQFSSLPPVCCWRGDLSASCPGCHVFSVTCFYTFLPQWPLISRSSSRKWMDTDSMKVVLVLTVRLVDCTCNPLSRPGPNYCFKYAPYEMHAWCSQESSSFTSGAMSFSPRCYTPVGAVRGNSFRVRLTVMRREKKDEAKSGTNMAPLLS